jgi:hypothetical protein
MLFDLQLKCVVSDGLTPAPVLPVVALIWTSVFNNPFAASGNKNCIAVAKRICNVFGISNIGFIQFRQTVNKDLPLNFLSFVNLKSFPKSIILGDLQIDFVLKLNRFTMTQTQENYIYIRVYGIGKIHNIAHQIMMRH